jgi:predicted peroxiredoxin
MLIPLEKAIEILENASAIVANDTALVYPAFREYVDDDVFMYLSWDSEGLEFHLEFQEELNKEVEVVGSSMFLKRMVEDDEIETEQLTILVPIEPMDKPKTN